MGLNCGIVGLPNVGKSTLFNAITSTSNAASANYPFCTIDPNSGRVPVPDHRLDELAKVAGSASIIPSFLEITDIAGLVKGASKGEGLGNQFLGHIRSTNAIIHMVRCFDSGDIVHVENSVDPIRDVEIIETELMLADLESLQKRKASIEKKAKGQDKDAVLESEVINDCIEALDQGKSLLNMSFDGKSNPETRRAVFNSLCLLNAKPVLYVANVDEEGLMNNGNEFSKKLEEFAKKRGALICLVCAKIEEEMIEFSAEEKATMLKEYNQTESGLDKIVKIGYKMLDMISFFTIGPKEAHSWSLKRGGSAVDAAAEIHSDIAKGFIRAEIISCNDYIEFEGENGCKDKGKMRVEGKEYITQDGDVCYFRFNV